MKVIFDNLIESATLSNLYPSANYPVSNLSHILLEKRYQPLSSLTDTITGTWSTNQTADCFVLAFHTLSAYTLRFRNAANTIIYTTTNNVPTDFEVVEFTELTTIRKVEILVTFTSTPSYLGGVGIGPCVDIGEFLSNYDLSPVDNSSFVESAYGQTLQSPRGTLSAFSFDIRDITLNEKNTIVNNYLSVKLGKPLYMIIFNVGVDDIPPLYAKFIQAPEVRKNGRRFDINIQIREAK